MVFVDLCFLCKIVRSGGLVVINDDWWPSTAVQDYERNTGWKVIPDAFAGETIGIGPHGEEGGRCKSLLLYRYGWVGVERSSRPGGVRGRLQACRVGR
ncbi:hypothetical protein [Streptomyces sp. NPDC056938]|uniref:hypothetical protein n=1 Tax=unclassified Streptomyces TaxID=2593676 RepID=UPI00364276B0